MNAQLPIEFDKSPTEIITMEGALTELLAKVDETINGFTPDLSTAKGRKEIASLAQKIARTKTAVDAAGKELTDEWRKKTNEVNEVRRLAREGLDERKEQVRKPLTDWEKEQEELEAKRSSEFQRLVDLSCPSFGETSESIKSRIEQVEAFDLGDWWGPMLERVHDEWKTALERLNNQFLQAETAEKQAAEMAELKRKQAEEDARRAKEEAEREAAAAKLKEEQEAAERAKREAEEEKARQEREADLARKREEQHKKDVAAAEERARKEEQDRIAAETARREREESKRKADAEYHDKVVSEAVQAITSNCTITTVQAAEIIELIEAGRVPHVSITF